MSETTKTDGDRRRAKEHAERGHAYWKQGNYSAAIEWFTRALSVDPNDAWTLMRRGAARAAISDIPGATDDLRRAASLVPGAAGSSQRQWASAQLGEGIRGSHRDAVLAPAASMADVEALLAEVGASIDAFTEALQEEPNSAWAYAHRAAATVLAHWLGARFGIDPERVRRYADSARSDLDTAMRLNGTYAWAQVFQAILLTVMGSNEPDGAERRAFFAQAAGRVVEAGSVDKNLVVLRPLVEFALYNREYDKAVELGWTQLARDPEDSITRYCVAASLKQLAESSGAGDATIEQVRHATAGAVVEQARKGLLAKRSRTCAMLGGLAMLEGNFEVAAAMLNDVLDYPDMDTLVFIWCDPAWAAVREPTAGPGSEPRLSTVKEAYARLFPRAPTSGRGTP